MLKNNTRILISIGTLADGGAERVVSILSKYFLDQFGQVEILMWYDVPVFYDMDMRIKLTFLPRLTKTSNRYKNILYFRKYVKQENPDIILSFLTPFNILVLLSLLGINKKIIVCERRDPRFIPGGCFMRFIRNNIYKLADGILVQTNYGLNTFPLALRKKMRVIYNPVMIPDRLIGKALLSSKENLFVSVGRLEIVKNYFMLLDAFKDFVVKNADYRLIIYGEGSYRKEIENYILRLGLQKNVSLPGNCKDVWNKILPAKAFFLTSNIEGMSNALIESMCLGLPVVSTKVSGSTELIKDGINGFLIDIGDTNALEEKMELLATHYELAEILGKNASCLFENLNSSTICNQWIGYIKQVINS